MRVAYTDLLQMFEESCERYADRPVLGTLRAGEWSWLTYAALHQMVDRTRAGLVSLGVGEGDRVAIVSDNRVEWAAICYACYGLGAALVPMYQSQLPSEWEFILGDCGAKVVFGATRAIRDSLERAKGSLQTLQHVISIEGDASDPRTFAGMLERGTPADVRRPSPETLAGLIYTSGTTGRPKGARLSHANIASNVSAVSEVFPLSPEDRSLSFLPWAHVYGQAVELHYLVSQGASAALNDDLTRLVDNMSDVKPTVLVAVPRIFNRVYAGVHRMMDEKGGIVRKLFDDGVRSAIRRQHGDRLGWLDSLELTLDQRIVFKKIRDRFGGRLRMVISASAALSLEVAEFIDAIGVMVYEGYGLTETSPVVTANVPGKRKIGSVGQPIPGVRVEIDKSVTDGGHEGEIVVYGPNVMNGYHNRPDENSKVFTPDGGFRTGDLGHFDKDGYLYITGRIKEQYKLTNGKYVMPTPIEEQIKLSPYITNVFLYGANRPFSIALVVPDRDALKRWAAESGHVFDDPTRSEDVKRLLQREVLARSAGFPAFQQPREIVVTTEDFTTENGMLTPTLKLKRRNVESRYAADFEAIYAARAGAEFGSPGV